jgi:metal-responsive CopG/Arc/MetJ family transcriptional regulator
MHHMQTQVTLRLPETLMTRLDRSATQLRRSKSDVIRMALEQYLAVDADDQPFERMRDLIGGVATGIPDLGEKHREYLVRRLRHAQ